MKLKELIGKTITNIYGVAEYNAEGVDTVECFVELDNRTFIEVPSYSNAQEVVEKDLINNAVCIGLMVLALFGVLVFAWWMMR